MRLTFRSLCGGLALILVVSVLLTGCTTTLRSSIDDRAATCGFVGAVCQKLTPGGDGQMYT